MVSYTVVSGALLSIAGIKVAWWGLQYRRNTDSSKREEEEPAAGPQGPAIEAQLLDLVPERRAPTVLEDPFHNIMMRVLQDGRSNPFNC